MDEARVAKIAEKLADKDVREATIKKDGIAPFYREIQHENSAKRLADAKAAAKADGADAGLGGF